MVSIAERKPGQPRRWYEFWKSNRLNQSLVDIYTCNTRCNDVGSTCPMKPRRVQRQSYRNDLPASSNQACPEAAYKGPSYCIPTRPSRSPSLRHSHIGQSCSRPSLSSFANPFRSRALKHAHREQTCSRPSLTDYSTSFPGSSLKRAHREQACSRPSLTDYSRSFRSSSLKRAHRGQTCSRPSLTDISTSLRNRIGRKRQVCQKRSSTASEEPCSGRSLRQLHGRQPCFRPASRARSSASRSQFGVVTIKRFFTRKPSKDLGNRPCKTSPKFDVGEEPCRPSRPKGGTHDRSYLRLPQKQSYPDPYCKQTPPPVCARPSPDSSPKQPLPSVVCTRPNTAPCPKKPSEAEPCPTIKHPSQFVICPKPYRRAGSYPHDSQQIACTKPSPKRPCPKTKDQERPVQDPPPPTIVCTQPSSKRPCRKPDINTSAVYPGPALQQPYYSSEVCPEPWSPPSPTQPVCPPGYVDTSSYLVYRKTYPGPRIPFQPYPPTQTSPNIGFRQPSPFPTSLQTDFSPQAQAFRGGPYPQAQAFRGGPCPQAQAFRGGPCPQAQAFGGGPCPQAQTFRGGPCPQAQAFRGGPCPQAQAFRGGPCPQAQAFRGGPCPQAQAFRGDPRPRAQGFFGDTYRQWNLPCQHSPRYSEKPSRGGARQPWPKKFLITKPSFLRAFARRPVILQPMPQRLYTHQTLNQPTSTCKPWSQQPVVIETPFRQPVAIQSTPRWSFPAPVFNNQCTGQQTPRVVQGAPTQQHPVVQPHCPPQQYSVVQVFCPPQQCPAAQSFCSPQQSAEIQRNCPPQPYSAGQRNCPPQPYSAGQRNCPPPRLLPSSSYPQLSVSCTAQEPYLTRPAPLRTTWQEYDQYTSSKNLSRPGDQWPNCDTVTSHLQRPASLTTFHDPYSQRSCLVVRESIPRQSASWTALYQPDFQTDYCTQSQGPHYRTQSCEPLPDYGCTNTQRPCNLGESIIPKQSVSCTAIQQYRPTCQDRPGWSSCVAWQRGPQWSTPPAASWKPCFQWSSSLSDHRGKTYAQPPSCIPAKEPCPKRSQSLSSIPQHCPRQSPPSTAAKNCPTRSIPCTGQQHCHGQPTSFTDREHCPRRSSPCTAREHCPGRSQSFTAREHCPGRSQPFTAREHCHGRSQPFTAREHCPRRSSPSPDREHCPRRSSPSPDRQHCPISQTLTQSFTIQKHCPTKSPPCAVREHCPRRSQSFTAREHCPRQSSPCTDQKQCSNLSPLFTVKKHCSKLLSPCTVRGHCPGRPPSITFREQCPTRSMSFTIQEHCAELSSSSSCSSAREHSPRRLKSLTFIHEPCPKHSSSLTIVQKPSKRSNILSAIRKLIPSRSQFLRRSSSCVTHRELCSPPHRPCHHSALHETPSTWSRSSVSKGTDHHSIESSSLNIGIDHRHHNSLEGACVPPGADHQRHLEGTCVLPGPDHQSYLEGTCVPPGPDHQSYLEGTCVPPGPDYQRYLEGTFAPPGPDYQRYLEGTCVLPGPDYQRYLEGTCVPPGPDYQSYLEGTCVPPGPDHQSYLEGTRVPPGPDHQLYFEGFCGAPRRDQQCEPNLKGNLVPTGTDHWQPSSEGTCLPTRTENRRHFEDTSESSVGDYRHCDNRKRDRRELWSTSSQSSSSSEVSCLSIPKPAYSSDNLTPCTEPCGPSDLAVNTSCPEDPAAGPVIWEPCIERLGPPTCEKPPDPPTCEKPPDPPICENPRPCVSVESVAYQPSPPPDCKGATNAPFFETSPDLALPSPVIWKEHPRPKDPCCIQECCPRRAARYPFWRRYYQKGLSPFAHRYTSRKIMGMHGCGRCIKYVVFFFNALILAGGIAVLAIGIWTLIDKRYFERLLGSDLYMSSASILITMGATIIIISFIGCVGAVKEIKCLLLTYFIILFLIFVVLLIGGILGYVFKNKVRETAYNVMLATLREDYGFKKFVTESWDTVQTMLKCCGIKQMANKTAKPYDAWRMNDHFGKIRHWTPVVPLSCCVKDNKGNYKDEKGCQGGPVKPGAVHDKDCLESLLENAERHAVILGGVGIGIAILMFLGIIFSFILFKLIE